MECQAKGGECDESKSRAVCGTDNQTYPTRCHLLRAQCSGHKVNLKHRGPCKGKSLHKLSIFLHNKLIKENTKTHTHAYTQTQTQSVFLSLYLHHFY